LAIVVMMVAKVFFRETQTSTKELDIYFNVTYSMNALRKPM